MTLYIHSIGEVDFTGAGIGIHLGITIIHIMDIIGVQIITIITLITMVTITGTISHITRITEIDTGIGITMCVHQDILVPAEAILTGQPPEEVV
jgi:hypothetical protein